MVVGYSGTEGSGFPGPLAPIRDRTGAVVFNPSPVRLIAESTLKTDELDAEVLARIGRLDLWLLRPPVCQHSEAVQELRTRLRVRTALVRARAARINTIRGTQRAQVSKDFRPFWHLKS